MGKVILWTSHCPRCKVLELKLKQKGIDYTTNTNKDEMIARGFKEAPKLEVDGVVMSFMEAVDWLKGQ